MLISLLRQRKCTMSSFSNFNLLPEIQAALKSKGYSKPTPIQEQAIPHLLEGGDMLGIAQTGTGKTAAFSLPIINKILSERRKAKPARMRCLILTPTRELASQIEDNIKSYSKGQYLKSAVIFGGVRPRDQILNLTKGLDIVVATPGRLLDLMNEGHVIFDQLEVFVLDEADRMLDMGFIRDVNKIIQKLPQKRQTLLFSATMPQDIAELSQKLLKSPKRVEITPESTTVEKIDQSICFIDKAKKPTLLKSILSNKKINHVLVFTKTKHGANRLADQLEKDNIISAAIHGNKSQGAREKALNGFKTGKIRVLVATDIAARGIDVASITHVINYNLPDDPKSYVHRIGRTARAGREGVAISFCDPSEMKLLKDIEKCINYKIPTDEIYTKIKPVNKMKSNKDVSSKKRPFKILRKKRTRPARNQNA